MSGKSLGQVSDFDLKLLRVFKTVAECGSFSAAESLLGITRSAISLHMSDLEKRLGMRLCQRGRAGFSLTDEGREILRLSDTLLASMESFRQQVNQLNRQLRGEFSIALINNLVTTPQMQITDALAEMRRRAPEVRINLSMSTPADIERGLLDGRIQVGALPLTVPLSGLDYQPLYTERSSLYCSHTHPLFGSASLPDDAQLQALDAVAPGSRMTAETIGLHQRFNCSASASDREGIAFLILTGQFVGFLPDHYANHWVARGMMRALAPQRFCFDSRIALVTRKGRRPNAILELFLQAIQQTGADQRVERRHPPFTE